MVEALQNARPWSEVVVNLAQTVGTQIVIIFLIDRTARLIECMLKRREAPAVDLFGPKPIRITQVVGASSAGAPTTPPPAGSTGSSTPSDS